MKKNNCLHQIRFVLMMCIFSLTSLTAFAEEVSTEDAEAAALLAEDDDVADLLGDDSEDEPAAAEKESTVPEIATKAPESTVSDTKEVESVATEGEETAEVADDDDSSFLDAFSSRETIFVIQKKTRLVGGTFEITPQFMQSVSDRFVSHTGFLVGAAYHFRESFSLQLDVGAFGWWDDPSLYLEDFNANAAPRIGGRLTSMSTELQERERLTGELVNYYWMTWVTALNFQWSAIRGKMSIHGLQLGDFSLFLSVGGGLAGYHNYFAPDLKNGLGLDFLGPVRIFSSLGAGLRFYFFDWLGLHFEVKDYIQPLSLVEVDINNQPNAYEGPTFSIRHTIMAQAGLSFVLPSFHNLY